jgi:hypothetical protein
MLFCENNKFYFEIGPNYGFVKKYYQYGDEIYSIVKKDYDKHDKILCLDFNSKIGFSLNDKLIITLGYYRTEYSYDASSQHISYNDKLFLREI